MCAMIIIRSFEQGRCGRMAQVCGQNYEEKKSRGELRGTDEGSWRELTSVWRRAAARGPEGSPK